MKNLALFFSFFVFFLSACKNSAPFKILPEGPIKHQLIVAGKTLKGISARGFKGATPPGTKIFFESGGKHLPVFTTSDGSFRFDLLDSDKKATHGQFTFVLPKSTQPIIIIYKLKELDDALALLAKEALTTPQEVDHVDINNNSALILSTEAAQLRRITINDDWTLAENESASILLNPKVEQALSPRSLASRGHHALVTMFNSHDLGLIDLQDNKLLESSRIDKTNTRSAEQILALNPSTFVVSFVNYNKNTQSIDAPGVIALLKVENNQIKPKQVLSLAFKNPQFFKVKNGKELWVSCSGDLKRDNTQDAGLVKLLLSDDQQSFEGDVKNIAFKQFTPGGFELIENSLIIPELWGKRVIVLATNANEIKDEDYKTPDRPYDYNFTIASHWHDNIVFIGDASGSLIAYSLNKNEANQDEGFFPFPFVDAIKLDKDQGHAVKFVPHQIIFRHHATNTPLTRGYPTGYSAWVVSQVQSRIIPIDFLEIFGP